MRTSVRRLLFVTMTTGRGTSADEAADGCAGVQARFSQAALVKRVVLCACGTVLRLGQTRGL
jgi:hypothetical protein